MGRRRRTGAAGIAAVAVTAALVGAGGAAQARSVAPDLGLLGGSISRVDATPSGAAPDYGGQLEGPNSVSADGRYVLFDSAADDIVPGATGDDELYVRDTVDGTTRLVTRRLNGEPQTGYLRSSGAALSSSGRYVVYVSSDRGLPDANGADQIYRYDLQSGHLSDESLTSTGAPPGSADQGLGISSSGRYVVYSALPGNGRLEANIYRYDNATRTTTLVTVALTGGPAEGFSLWPSVSDDGRYVAFSSTSLDLTGTAVKGHRQIYLADLDRATGNGITALTDITTGSPHVGSMTPVVSADGSAVVFNAQPGLVPGGPTNQIRQSIYRYDVATGTLALVSNVVAATPRWRWEGWHPSISSDGRFIAYGLEALGAGGAAHQTDVVRYDALTGRSVLVLRSAYAATTVPGDQVAISGDGRHVAFDAVQMPIVDPGDTNGQRDVYEWNHIPPR